MVSNGEISRVNGELTLAVLGCGTLGTAILSGILSSLRETQGTGSASSTAGDAPSRLPSSFIACVRSDASVKRLERALSQDSKAVKFVQNDNVKVCSDADVIILGCKPYMVNDILAAKGMKEALAGKVLISICAGVPVEQMEEALYGPTSSEDTEISGRCKLVRAMPNNAAGIRESATVVAISTPPLPEKDAALVAWIFEQVGEVAFLPAGNMDASTALCGSGTAFFALMLEAAIDGAVAMGLPRKEAMKLAAQAMKGCAGMVLAGEHPAVLRDKTTTPGGCTAGGLCVLEEGAVRGSVSKAIREATVVASQLGAGVKNVNGPRR